MTKILWLSRHPPIQSQLDELERLWPGGSVTHDADSFADAADIVGRIRRSGYDETVFVGPLSVLEALTRSGLRPLRAEMELVPVPPVLDPEWYVMVGRRCYRFRRFVRVTAVQIVTEPVT